MRCLMIGAVFWCILVSAAVNGTVISNLNVIFETFGPLSMVRFFEFNDIGWNITEKCIKDMFLYLDGLHKDVLWAVKLYDASGYYSGSIYAGNNIRRGSPQLCRELNAEMAISNFEAAPTSINGQHQSSHTLYDDIQEFMILSNFLPFPVHLVNAKYRTIVEGAPYATYIIHQTMCMPSSCTLDDLTQVMSYANLTHLRNNLIMRNTELVNVKILEESYEFYKDSAFYAFISLTAILLLLGSIGTIFESFVNFDVQIDLMNIERENANRLNNCQQSVRNSKNVDDQHFRVFKMNPLAESESDNEARKSSPNHLAYTKEANGDNDVLAVALGIVAPRYDVITSNFVDYYQSSSWSSSPHTVVQKIVLAFSFRRNFRILFSDLPHHCVADVIEISGLRMLSLLWMLLVHVCTVLYYVADNKIYKNQFDGFNALQAILDSGSLSIDTHFFLCGICVAHMFLNRLKNDGIEHICSCFNNFAHLSAMIMYKILGLSLPYAAGLLLLQFCMKHFNDFAIVDIPSFDHQTCATNMWRNLFYIDQFYPLDERCMIWSWILSLETQFFVVACIILLILKNHPRYGIAIFCSFLIGSFFATTALRFHDHHQHHKLNSSLEFDEHLAFYNGLYDQPWARLSPYFFGICMGYILHKTEEKLDINIVIVTCGWIACSFLLVALIFSKAFVPLSSHWMEAILSTINHTIWSMILVWVIVASLSKHRGFIGHLLASKALIPFNKLTNCFLIIYPLITRIILLSSDGSIHLSIGLIMTMYLGFAITTIFCSFLLYMVFEAPAEQLLRLIYNKNMN